MKRRQINCLITVRTIVINGRIFIKTTILLIFFMSVLSLTVVRPIIMRLFVVLYRVLSGWFIFFSRPSWLVYIILLLFLGGIIVVFTYVRSLVVMEKFIQKKTVRLKVFFLLVFMGGLCGGVFPLESSFSLGVKILKIIFDFYGCEVLLFLRLVLLLVLFMVTKMCINFKGSLKWKF